MQTDTTAAVETGLDIGEPRDRSMVRLALRQLLALPLAGLGLWLLHRQLAGVDRAGIAAAFAMIPAQNWAYAVMAALCSFWAAGRHEAVLHRICESAATQTHARTSGMVAAALSQTVGFGILSGALVRWRMLSGMSAASAVRFSALVSFSFLCCWSVLTLLIVTGAAVLTTDGQGVAHQVVQVAGRHLSAQISAPSGAAGTVQVSATAALLTPALPVSAVTGPGAVATLQTPTGTVVAAVLVAGLMLASATLLVLRRRDRTISKGLFVRSASAFPGGGCAPSGLSAENLTATGPDPARFGPGAFPAPRVRLPSRLAMLLHAARLRVIGLRHRVASLQRPALPGPLALIRILGFVALDIAAAGLCFWLLMPFGLAAGGASLPPTPGWLPLFGTAAALVFPVFMLALGAGLLSGTPAGAGPFEAVLLALLVAPAHRLGADQVIAGALAFRLVFFAGPALIALMVLARGPLPKDRPEVRRRGQRHVPGRTCSQSRIIASPHLGTSASTPEDDWQFGQSPERSHPPRRHPQHRHPQHRQAQPRHPQQTQAPKQTAVRIGTGQLFADDERRQPAVVPDLSLFGHDLCPAESFGFRAGAGDPLTALLDTLPHDRAERRLLAQGEHGILTAKGSTKEGFANMRRRRFGSGQDGPGQDGPGQKEPGQDGPGQTGPGQDGPGQDGLAQDGIGQDGPVLRHETARVLAARTGLCLVGLFDPWGRPFARHRQIAPLVAQALTDQAAASDRLPCLYKISARWAAVLRGQGWQVAAVAREAWVNPLQFVPTGPARAQLRRKLRKAADAGVQVRDGNGNPGWARDGGTQAGPAPIRHQGPEGPPDPVGRKGAGGRPSPAGPAASRNSSGPPKGGAAVCPVAGPKAPVRSGESLLAIPPLPLSDMARIAASWSQEHGGERGFSMGRFAPDYVARQRVFLAYAPGEQAQTVAVPVHGPAADSMTGTATGQVFGRVLGIDPDRVHATNAPAKPEPRSGPRTVRTHGVLPGPEVAPTPGAASGADSGAAATAAAGADSSAHSSAASGAAANAAAGAAGSAAGSAAASAAAGAASGGDHDPAAFASGPAPRLTGFVTFHATPSEWTLDLMRTDRSAADGVMQALVVAAIRAAAAEGVPRLSLAAVPMIACGRQRGRVASWMAIRSGAAGLMRFKSAFDPTWETLYLAAPGRISLWIAAASLTRAIARPGPLKRAKSLRGMSVGMSVGMAAEPTETTQPRAA